MNSLSQKCPLCFEPIQKGAKACPHCGNFLHPVHRFWHKYFVPVIPSLIAGGVITLLSFYAGQSLERWRVFQEQQSYDRQIKVALAEEFFQDQATLAEMQEYIANNLNALKEGLMVINPLLSLRMAVWEQVNYGHSGLLQVAGSAETARLRGFYSVLYRLNDMIRNREQFRLMREGTLPDFSVRLGDYDGRILKEVDKALAIAEQAKGFFLKGGSSLAGPNRP